MEMIFQEEFAIAWIVAMALALFLPVRQLIWVMYVRRAERSGPTDETERNRLRKRAAITAALLCFVFSAFYVNHLFSD